MRSDTAAKISIYKNVPTRYTPTHVGFTHAGSPHFQLACRVHAILYKFGGVNMNVELENRKSGKNRATLQSVLLYIDIGMPIDCTRQ